MVRSPLAGAHRRALGAQNIKRATHEDTEWLIDLAERGYRKPYWDRAACRRWIALALKNPQMAIFRSEHAALLAVWQPVLPNPSVDREGVFPYWGNAGEGDPREIIDLFIAGIEWLKANKVRQIWLRPTTGVDAGPVARILGFRLSPHPAFVMEIADDAI